MYPNAASQNVKQFIIDIIVSKDIKINIYFFNKNLFKVILIVFIIQAMTFKSDISFTLIFFIFLINTIKGDVYKCASDLNIDTCHLTGQENGQTVTYIGKCPKGKTCEIINGIGKCIVTPTKATIGSSCSVNLECLTGLCKNNICTAQKNIGDACTSNEDCPINAICTGTSKVCTQFVEPNGVCTANTDCIVGYACNDDKKCDKMYEKTIGTACSVDILCETGRALLEENGGRKCVQYEEPDGDCLQRNIQTESTDTNYYCDPKYQGITKAKQKYSQCQPNYKGNYICATKKTEALNRYISLFKEVYTTLSEDAKRSRLTNRDYLNNDTLKEAFDAFDKFLEFRPEVECAQSTDNDDGNDSDIEDNENQNGNGNDNKNGNSSDSTSIISVSLSVFITFLFL